MTCKNCEAPLQASDNYCPHCGAKVIRERITLRRIMGEWLERVFGWDNQYFRTVRYMVLQPEVLLREYLDGTRKKYVHPFSFLMLGAAISLLVLTQFSGVYLKANKEMSDVQSEMFIQMFPPEILERSHQQALAQGDSLAAQLTPAEFFKANQFQRVTDFQKIYLQYFNFAIILILPVFGFISMWVFGKPYNYGEHLVINAYCQGFLFLSGLVLFLMAILFSPQVYFYSIFVGMIFYSYAYGRLYQLSIGKVMQKLLKFIGILFLFLLGLLILGIIAGIVSTLLKS